MNADTANYLRGREGAVSFNRQQRAADDLARRRSRPTLWRRIFKRQEITTFHRCLAVHMHFAERRGILR